MLPHHNIFLIGPMGAGKTTVGRRLARALGLPFVDSDHEIEARTGVEIPYIFEREGEAGFRLRERQTIADLAQRQGLVMATGGGAVITPENRTTLAQNGMVVYLHASVDQQLSRTRHSRHRPLLQNAPDRRAVLRQLLSQREPLYREIADLTLITDHRSSRHVAREAENFIKAHLLRV
ncbi:shikimate kinase AroK [Sinimarinibacterium sp. NLF-5-8]|uniref:shikimate kinase AroK n=1 Tax=Sinimarinibacterium sp. NLF-5-8 TaxID=2698684 RepID=UPI00137C039D|nr:shikimate kinase AroK [Sinimarinibacterium sp. NLF-5-8]QHS10784.1 shikimate kinase AroK [Sinimarinibacterium sp. NLF-5-8]